MCFVLSLGIFFTACCDPKLRDSMPLVIDSTFSDTAIKDVFDRFSPNANPLDSGYYPIYSINIKNTGTEADTFQLSYERVGRSGYFLPVVVRQFVQPGEVKTFTTPGPIPDHGNLPTSDFTYISFFVHPSDSTKIHKENPTVTIHYGTTQNDVESCGSKGQDMNVDISKWKD